MPIDRIWLGVVLTAAVLLFSSGVRTESALEEVNGGSFSQVQVVALNNLERRVHEQMKNYLKKLKEQQTLIEWYLEAYEARKPDGRRRSSPIFTYLTMKRLTVEIVNILKNMKSLNSFSDYLEEESKSSEWPQEDDVGKVTAQVLNIYNTYDLTAGDLALGTFHGSYLGVTLDAHQCFEIGKYAVTQKQFGSACEWMNTGLGGMINLLPKQMEAMMIYVGVITSAINTHNRLLTEHLKVSSSLSTEQVWTTDLFVKEIAQLTSFERRKIRHRHAKTNGTKLLRGVSQEIKFQQICSQKLNKGPAADVFCWYERSLYPYLILNPLKIELLKRKPFTIQIYNFLPMSTRNDLVELGIPKLARLQVTPAAASSSFSQSQPEANPSQFHAEFSDYEMSIFEPFIKKIERIVGNYDRIKSPHAFYVSMYALGGFMEPPIDSLLESKRRKSPPTSNAGQRATILAYVNYVQAGAFTAFPQIGVATFPTFASVVVMYADSNAPAQNPRPCPIVSGQNYLLVHSMDGVMNPFTFV